MRRLTAAALVALALAIGVVTTSAQQSVYIWTRAMFGDGTAAAPSIAFAAAPDKGWFNSGAGQFDASVNGTAQFRIAAGNVQLPSANTLIWLSGVMGSGGDTSLTRGAAGAISLTNASTIGTRLKVDALPVAGTCGTSPAVTAGSTPFAGSVNVGTGGTATSCTVTFGGTAFPAAPFCTLGQSAGTFTTYTATTTVLTLSAATAWPASTVVSWFCASSK